MDVPGGRSRHLDEPRAVPTRPRVAVVAVAAGGAMRWNGREYKLQRWEYDGKAYAAVPADSAGYYAALKKLAPGVVDWTTTFSARPGAARFRP